MSTNEILLFSDQCKPHNNEPLLTVVSDGMGQDSKTIILKLVYDKEFRKKHAPNDLLIIFSDTHSEHDETYEYLEKVRKPFVKKHNLNFVHLTNDMGFHNKNWMSLEGQWRAGNKPTLTSTAFQKSCTHNLKLQPQWRYVEDYISKKYNLKSGNKTGFKQFAKFYGKIRWIIGIAKDEEARLENIEIKEQWRNEAIETVFPLMEIGYNRKDCQEYIKSLNYAIPIPSNCVKCPYGTGAFELLWMYYNHPKYFYDWANDEKTKLDFYVDQCDFIIDCRTEEDKNKKVKGKDKKIYIDIDEIFNLQTLLDAKEIALKNSIRVRVRVVVYVKNELIEKFLLENPIFEKKKIKNLGVSGKVHTRGDKKGQAKTLLDLIEEYKTKHPNVTIEQLNEYKWSHGHCVQSKY